MITEPKWKSYIVETTTPIFTPKKCQMIIEAGRRLEALKVLEVESMILKQEHHILVGYLLKKCMRCIKI